MSGKLILLLSAILVLSCNHHPNETQPKTDTAMAAHQNMAIKSDLKGLALASKMDLSCGMPLSAGLEDTVNYKGKIYGFCSKECKDEFLKDPEAHIAKSK